MNNLLEDALKELCNIGSGSAATALSNLLDLPVNIEVPEAIITPIENLHRHLNNLEQFCCVNIEFGGDLLGYFFLIFESNPIKSINNLVDSKIILSSMKLLDSVIEEISNILVGNFLVATSELTNYSSITKPPHIIDLQLKDLLDGLSSEENTFGDKVLFIKNDIVTHNNSMKINLLLLFNPSSLEKLLNKLGYIARVELIKDNCQLDDIKKKIKRVMVVDDSFYMRFLLSKLLENNGYDVVAQADDGLKAISMHSKTNPDLTFMDITMPVMDGIGAIKAILSFKPGANIIVCSAMGQKKTIMEAIKAGARDFIIKPFEEQRILQSIKKINLEQ